MYVAWLLLAGCCALTAQAQVSKEYQIKAGFVFHFAKFLEWPAESFADDDAPIVIGVFPKSRYLREVGNAVKDRKVNGRPFVVQEVKSVEEARSVHMLVFDATNGRLEEILPALKDTSVLTIGESEPFAENGGMLNFVREGDKLRFEINLDAVRESGLKISAQFLKLARTVRKK